MTAALSPEKSQNRCLPHNKWLIKGFKAEKILILPLLHDFSVQSGKKHVK